MSIPPSGTCLTTCKPCTKSNLTLSTRHGTFYPPTVTICGHTKLSSEKHADIPGLSHSGKSNWTQESSPYRRFSRPRRDSVQQQGRERTAVLTMDLSRG